MSKIVEELSNEDLMAELLSRIDSEDDALSEREVRAAINKQAHQVSIVWGVDDVLAEEVAPHLSDEEALKVLELAERQHDSNNGVTWETLRATADSFDFWRDGPR